MATMLDDIKLTALIAVSRSSRLLIIDCAGSHTKPFHVVDLLDSVKWLYIYSDLYKLVHCLLISAHDVPLAPFEIHLRRSLDLK